MKIKTNYSPEWTTIIMSMIAVVLSSTINHSFWWGLFHFFCGWMYVLYWLLEYSNITYFINDLIVRG